MNISIEEIFCKNQYLDEKIHEFCKTLPEYQQARARYDALEEQIDRAMGRKFYLEFERVRNEYMAQEVQAYYRFGLGLRQEVLSALLGPLSQLR